MIFFPPGHMGKCFSFAILAVEQLKILLYKQAVSLISVSPTDTEEAIPYL